MLMLMMASTSSPPASGHRYWRISVSESDGSAQYIGFTEIEMRGSAGGGNLIPLQTGGGRADASSIVNSSNAAYLAADGLLTTGWLSDTASPSWWRFDFNTLPADVKQIAIRGSYNSPTSSPKDFTLQWSDDDTAWTTVLTVTGQTGWTGASDIRTFDVP